MRLHHTAIAAALMSCLLVAQETQQKPGEPPEFKTQTSLVYVDVTVTDARGNAMRGLSAKDFSLTENGIPQQITSVSFAPQTVRVAPKLKPGEFTNEHVLPQQGTLTLILFDEV